MPGLKNRFMDEVIRVVRRYMRLEICAVDKVNFHSSPEDHKFNTVDVVMRDRAKKDGKYPIRKQLPVLQNFLGGHCGGHNWNPRRGDLVWVFFYGGRQGIVLANAWSWAEYPACRPTPYDITDKGGQWQAPYQDPCGDFPRQPYPELKKPYCFRWFHGPVTGSTGPGRDWAFLFDYCHLGDSSPSCKDCKNIDSICHVANHFLKFYSTETESRKAYPGRGLYHAPGGAYWLFDSYDAPDETYISEFYTHGAGFWTIQGAVDEVLKGHIRHYPEGDIEIHSATSSQDGTGTRCTVAAPNSSLFDFAWEAIHFATGAFRRILKDGKIQDSSPVEIKLTAPDIVLDGDVEITGSCTHGACSCDGEFATLDGKAGGQTLCGGTEEDEVLTLCGTSNASKGQVTVDADLECTGDLCTQIKAAIKGYCDTLYAAGGALADYAKLAGITGGQALCGGSGASENLTLQSTAHATKGKILFGASAYDEVNNRLGIGVAAPANALDIVANGKIFFSDNGEIRSKDANHRLVFDRENNILDLIEFGSIYLSPGATSGERTSEIYFSGGGNLYLAGNCSALSFTDRTPAFIGDALAEIRKIPLGITDEIDHASLPEFARTEDGEGRNIGNMVSLLTAATRQLIKRIEDLEKELAAEKAKQSMEILNSEPPAASQPQFFMSSGDLKIKLPDGTVKTISMN